MSDKLWSFARQQKYDFCRRAFYFQYKSSFKPDSSESNSSGLNLYNLKIFSYKSLFYDRTLSLSSFLKPFYREVFKLGIETGDAEKLIDELSRFKNSEFYLSTAPALVHHRQVGDFQKVSVGEVDIIGSVHFIWTENSGQVNIVNMNRKLSPFTVMYGLRVMGTSPDKLNLGLLNSSFEVDWHEINWSDIQEMQDSALSFNYSNDIQDFPLAENRDSCSYCSYYETCTSVNSGRRPQMEHL